MKRRNIPIPILMMTLALLGLTACEDEVKLDVIEGLTQDNVVGYYNLRRTESDGKISVMLNMSSGEKGYYALELFEDKTGYVIFREHVSTTYGYGKVFMDRINSYSVSPDGSSMTFSSERNSLNGTYQASKDVVNSLNLTIGSQVFFFRKSQDMASTLTEYRWYHYRGSSLDAFRFDFNKDMTGQLADFTQKKHVDYPFTYILDPKTKQLQIIYSNGSKTVYDYTCITSGLLRPYLLLFKKKSDSSGFTVEQYEGDPILSTDK